jgi:H+-transporting ATPase
MTSGLTQAEAEALLVRFGPNAIAIKREHWLLTLARRFWGPIPWVLEVALVLTLVTRRYGDGIAIGFLLLFNAVIAAWQEGKARNALELLRSRLVIQARVKRDGQWTTLPADRIVPGDLVHLGLSDVVPADVRLLDGSIDVDESALTGESLPKTLDASGAAAYAGSIVRRGQAEAEVTATGTSTKFGRTAELVRTAKSTGTLERLVMRLVSALAAIGIVVVSIISVAALRYGLNGVDIAVFAIMVALASVPIALPAAFTLATTFGSLDLVKRGTLVTRLSAIEDSASMDVLCSDKTGTITQNRIAVDSCLAYAPFAESDLFALAAAASDEAGQDPIDLAVLHYPRERQPSAVARTAFTPFDPAVKRSSAEIAWNGQGATAYKGSPVALRSMIQHAPESLDADVERVEGTGARVLAVALRQASGTAIVGLIALADPPRDDAADLVARLHALGIKVIMLTGDSLPTALHVAKAVGIPQDAVRASIYPDDKLSIIRNLQKEGHVVGMTGDGINDAPALKQANIGIAVANATDVAKAAAGVVLTRPGLANIVSAIEAGRQVYERMLTYTMLKLVKYFEIIGVLSIGFFLTRNFLLRPELMVALLLFNDFVTLSIATDNVSISHAFDVWRVGRLLVATVSIATLTTLSVFVALSVATRVWHPDIAHLQGIVFLALVAMGQLSVFVVRERESFFARAPSRWLLATGSFAFLAACTMALFGLLMPALPTALVGTVVALLVLCAAALNLAKLPIFAFAGLR